MAIPQMRKRTQMVETEMGRMVPKADQEKFEKEAGESLDRAVASPYKMAMAERAEKMKAKAAREIVFKRGREAVATPLKSYKSISKLEKRKENAEEKVKLAKDFYESEPVKLNSRKVLLDTMKARLSRIK
jgi:hypothetical protein